MLLPLLPTLLALSPIKVETKSAVFMNGQRIGEGSIRNEIDSQGRLHQTIHSTMTMADMKRVMDYEALTDKNGRTIKETEVDLVQGQKLRMVFETGPKILKITFRMGSESRVQNIPIPKGNISDPSVFWFIQTKPKIGASVTYLHYAFQSGKWETATKTYVGDDAVPETKLTGHHIKTKDGDEWLDDKGSSIRAETKMENGIPMVTIRQ